jgi:hypothetical protein
LRVEGNDLQGFVEWSEDGKRYYRAWRFVPQRGMLQVQREESEKMLAAMKVDGWGPAIAQAVRDLNEAAVRPAT